MIILNKTYGFTSGQLAAPQANAMAAVIEPLMNGVGAPWLLYGIGAVLAIVLNFCKIPALAFALGMFIPLELNVPLVVGGAVNWYVTSRSKDAALNAERGEKGTLLASGFIAGGALMRGKRGNALRRCEPCERRMAQQHMVRSTGTGCLRYPDILSRQSFDENEISCGDTEISS